MGEPSFLSDCGSDVHSREKKEEIPSPGLSIQGCQDSAIPWGPGTLLYGKVYQLYLSLWDQIQFTSTAVADLWPLS